MIQKKLLSGLFWVLLANLIVKPFWILGIEVGVQNAVGNEAYGFYFSLFSFSYIFNILLDLGITNFNTRNIAQHPQLISKHLPGILSIKICLLALYVVVTFSVGLLMGYGSREFRLLALLVLCQFFSSLILYLRSNFEGLLLFKWDSLFSVLDRVLMIVICGFLLWGPKFSIFNFQFSIYHFVYAQLAAYAITALLAFIVIVRKAIISESAGVSSASHLSLSTTHQPCPESHRRSSPFTFHLSPLTFHLSPAFALVILKKSAPFALLVLLMASYNRIDPILLRRLAGDAAAGIYAGAFRLLDALTMVGYLVSVPLLPVFSRLCREVDKLNVDKLIGFRKNGSTNQQINGSTDQPINVSTLSDIVRLVFWPMMFFSVGVSVACTLWAAPLMELLYHGHGEAYVPVFRVVIFGLIPIGLTYIFGTLLTAGGYLRQLNFFAAATLVLNVVVNLLLIPRLGAVGSAWASLTAQSFMALAQFILAVRIFRLPPSTFRLPGIADARQLFQLFSSR